MGGGGNGRWVVVVGDRWVVAGGWWWNIGWWCWWQVGDVVITGGWSW